MGVPKMKKGTPMDLMLDLETMDTASTAAVTAIGAVFFEPQTEVFGNEFYISIDLESAVNSGRTMSAGTVKWWLTQSQEAQKAMTEDVTAQKIAVNKFAMWLSEQPFKLQRIWAKSPEFDITIMQSLFKTESKNWPFQFWSNRDVRTLEDLAWPNGDKPKGRIGVHHNAVEDAKTQARIVQMGYAQLGIGTCTKSTT